MIQVDVFLSFAMGASLATLAGDKLKAYRSIYDNQYFVYTVCFFGIIFSPSGVYMLWEYTGWETMFFYGRDDLHGLAVCLFASSNVLLGVLGFYCCASLVRSDHHSVAHHVWTSAYVATFSIATFGYERAFYAGTLQQFRAGVKFPWTDFIGCEVFNNLLVMCIFAIPPLYYPMIAWPAGPEMDADRKSRLVRDAVLPYVRVTALVVVVFVTLLVGGLLPRGWQLDRLVAFILGQFVFGLGIFLPLRFVSIVPQSKNKTPKSN